MGIFLLRGEESLVEPLHQEKFLRRRKGSAPVLNRISHLVVSAMLLGGVIPILLLPATPNPAQGKKPNFGSTPGPPVTKTKLEVKQFK
jgi:hypothetical protein